MAYVIDKHAVLGNCSIHLTFVNIHVLELEFHEEVLLGYFNGVALPVTASYANFDRSCFNHLLYSIRF